MSKIILSHIALISANLIYALNYLFAKDVMPDYIDPSAFIFFRVIGGATFFSLIHFFYIREKIEKRDFSYLILCALLGVVINMLCFFEGLSLTSPINASLIMITTPLLVYLISFFLSRSERSFQRFLGVILGLIGAMNLISDGSMKFRIENYGDLLIFINALSYAIYLILVKKMMNKYNPITILKTIFSIASIILLPISYSSLVVFEPSLMPLPIIMKFFYVIIFTTCIAYFCNIFALINLTSSTVAFYIYLQPLLATIFSLILGKDVLTAIKIISATAIFIGVYFVLKTRTI
ncbi:MAG: EamA family transporter [Flavobacteriales bacterium]|nr:EamA family transporter [Flavobacteriales bacterium]